MPNDIKKVRWKQYYQISLKICKNFAENVHFITRMFPKVQTQFSLSQKNVSPEWQLPTFEKLESKKWPI